MKGSNLKNFADNLRFRRCFRACGNIDDKAQNNIYMEDDTRKSDTPEREETPADVHGIAEQEEKPRPELVAREKKRGIRIGDYYVRVTQPYRHLFHRVEPGHYTATPESDYPKNPLARGYMQFKRLLIGRPLRTAEEGHQRLTKFKALAIFGSDAISSSAYATEASLVVLMVAGNSALNTSLYTALAIAILLSVVAFSYRQTVHAYPHGGGSYNVSRENLGRLPGLVAAAALLIDYIMTVAVSIAAGSAAITSAIIVSGYGAQIDAITATLPAYFNLNVMMSLVFIGVVTLGNLRGVRESGTIFAAPTYLFIIGVSALLIAGMVRLFTGTLQPVTPPPVLPITQPLTLWLVLRAFSAGAVAMSGTEAISNGVQVFQKPESRNAATTLTVMATLLGTFFLGLSYLSTKIGLVPGEETVISQVAQAVFGRNAFYYVFQVATMGILVIAANTAFAGFPRLASVLARDNYMPHQFLNRGDRLSFSSGITFLGIISALLLVLFRGNVDSLIHLYAVGVFLAFTMSCSGMVVHWWRTRGPGWRTRIIINGVGAILTGAILIIVAVTKFMFGAWIVIILIPMVVAVFIFINRHYSRVAAQLRITPGQLPAMRVEHFAVVPIDDVNKASLRAMSFARTICKEIVVLHISTDEHRAERVKQKMRLYASDLEFVIVDSPLRTFIRPMLAYIESLHAQHPGAFVTVILPEFLTAHWWEKFLHNRTADRLRTEFEKHPNVNVVLVPYLLER
jgi:amino acid transporter